MRFGAQIMPGAEPVADYIDFIKRVEGAGFDVITVADSYNLSSMGARDLYMALTLAAEHTKTAWVGPAVTNLRTRHLYTTVNGICSVDDIAEGRTLMIFGSGESPVHQIGRTMSPVSEMREGVLAMKALCAGKPYSWEGKELVPGWRKPHLPIFISANGPKALQLGGEAADGVMTGAGVTPEVLGWARGQVEEGAKRAGRKKKVDLWFNAICHFEADGDSARRNIRARLGTRVRSNLRVGFYAVPDAHLEEAKNYKENYDENDVGAKSGNIDLMTDYLVNRFAVAGTVAESIERFAEMASHGAETVIIALPFEFESSRRIVDAFEKDILPLFRD